MGHTIHYQGTDEEIGNKAYQDAIDYLGQETFDKVIAHLKELEAEGKIRTIRQFDFTFSFVGVQGRPVAEIVARHFPELKQHFIEQGESDE